MRLLSRLKTSVAYDAGQIHKGSHRVVIAPGVNVLSDQDEAVLADDPHFKLHADNGHLVQLPDEAPAPAPVAADDEDDDVNAADPLARQPGESKKAHKARLKAGADNPPAQLAPEDQAMIDAYKALTTDEAREGYKAMLDERQLAILGA